MNSPVFTSISTDNNMGVVRYILCFIVIILHVVDVAEVNLPWAGTDIAVGCFFSLSGFLLFASFQRSPTWQHYVERRARRILPPYFTVVLACAIGFAAISTLSWREYFSNLEFWEYLGANLSFMNFLHPQLPGVFQGEEFASHSVNGSLWTMKGEWACYLSIPFIFRFIANSRRRATRTLVAFIALSLALRYLFYTLEASCGERLYGIIAKQFGSLLVFFFIGALANVYYHEFLKYKWWILGVAVALWLTADYNPVYYSVVRPFVGASFALWFSLVGKWATFLKNHDDKSYDMYLFHFPIIQLAVYWGWAENMPPMAFLAAITALTFAAAWLSARFIGSRFIGSRFHKRRPA